MWENNLLIEKIKEEKNLILVLLLYSLFSIILFSHYKYVINSDGIAYISIAKYYFDGHISYAINGYWSPLYSWILLPFLVLWSGNLGNIMVMKIMGVIIGLFTLTAINSILNNLNIDIGQKTILLLSLIPFVLYFSLRFTTPDLLVTCILLYYFNCLIDKKYRKLTSLGLITGILGAIAFLAKSYCFYFFIVHFILTSLFFMKNFPEDRSVIKKNFLLGLSIFLVISGVWVGIISEKYGVITVGTAGSYNHAIVGPNSNGHLTRYQILTPPHEFAVSSWEDPSYFEVNKWNPLESKQALNHQITIILGNIWIILFFSISNNFITFFAFILALYLFLKSSKKSIKNNIILFIGTMIIYTGGYTFIVIEERYLSFFLLLSFLLAFYSLSMLFKENLIKYNYFKFVSIFLGLLLFLYPILPMSNLPIDGYSEVYDNSLELKLKGVMGNMASNGQCDVMLYYCYYLDSKYYGVAKNQSNIELKENLISNKIDYYFIWGDPSSNLDLGEIVYQNRDFRVLRVSKS
jgi:hypothetical protein